MISHAPALPGSDGHVGQMDAADAEGQGIARPRPGRRIGVPEGLLRGDRSRRLLGLLDLGFGRRIGTGGKKQDQTQERKNSHLLLLSDAAPGSVNFNRHNRMTMSQSLQGKISIVTGASRGIGRGIALRLAAAGSSVVLCARDQALLDAAAAEIRARRRNRGNHRFGPARARFRPACRGLRHRADSDGWTSW